jgi:hypothetical protein
MRNGTASVLNSERELAPIPTAQGGLSRLAVARLKSAGVPVSPLLRRLGLRPEQIDEPEERLNVRSQIALLDEAAKTLKDDRLGFTLARDFDLRQIGLLYYVMASSQTLGEALKRLARYSEVTNEALVFGYREGNRLIVNLSYSGVRRPRSGNAGYLAPPRLGWPFWREATRREIQSGTVVTSIMLRGIGSPRFMTRSNGMPRSAHSARTSSSVR